jgi:hypothetical protein
MNSYLAVTDTPGRRSRCFSQKLGLHLQLTVFPLEFTQPGSFRHGQRRLLVGVLDSILVHPVAEGPLVDLDLTGHFGDRPGGLDHHLHGLVLELRAKFTAPFSQ